MITKIEQISKLGVFRNFEWDKECKDGAAVAEFKKLNVIYGRNYAGKTTLSRILRDIEKGHLDSKHAEASFKLIFDNGNSVDQLNLGVQDYVFRVYNKDFVTEHLGWLKDEQGNILPFAVVGEENVEIEKEIALKEELLGNIEKKSGLRYELDNKRRERYSKSEALRNAKGTLEGILRDKANNDIKRNAALYGEVNYTIVKIKEDIEWLKTNPQTLFDGAEIEFKKRVLNEQVKKTVSAVDIYTPTLSLLLEEAKFLLEKRLMPTQAIEELLKDAILQEWVRKGIEHHKGKRTQCAFCGNQLPSTLWDRLGSHFDTESELLRKDIQLLLKRIDEEVDNITKLMFANVHDFYLNLQTQYEEWEIEWNSQKEVYLGALESLRVALRKREADVFSRSTLPEIEDGSVKIEAAQKKFNEVVFANEKRTTTLKSDHARTRKELRTNEVARFIREIKFDDQQVKIKELENSYRDVEADHMALESKINQLIKEIDVLKTSLKDERKAADAINMYLNHFFGHEYLSFAAESADDKTVKFKILRGGEPAYNLSEGECSLLAFCYFIARLDDVNTKGKRLIVWIDDPVCSLDTNHIFFVFSLIESALAKAKQVAGRNEYRYHQCFISTHNLEFLKYVKRLTIPKKKIDGPDGKRKKVDDYEQFIIEREGQESFIRIMPDYLRKYVTEFNYLFHQIYKCSKTEQPVTDHSCFYNFGNNLRKFLEAYLFYKYPVHEDEKLNKIQMFFGNDSYSVSLTTRVSNELSHLEEIFDRSMKPLEIPEIPKLAQYVLSKIKERDIEQYHALLKSIGENDSE